MRIYSLTSWLRSLRKKNSQTTEKNTPTDINLAEALKINNLIHPSPIPLAFMSQPKIEAILGLGEPSTTVSEGFAGYPEELELAYFHAIEHFKSIYKGYLEAGRLYMIVRSWNRQTPFDPDDEFYGMLSIADHVLLQHFLISTNDEVPEQKYTENSRRSDYPSEPLL